MSTTPQDRDESHDEHWEKRVELVEKDEDEQIARGAVLVPDRLDHQGDFLRADTISDLREAFDERVESGDAYPGVMHAAFPQEDLELVEDRQLDEAETIGDKDLPAGTWVQGWKYTDDELWSLVDDGVLGGFSIGGTAKGVVYEPGAMPDDVEIPDPVQAELEEAGLARDDIMVREITDGRIMETSTVDQPAVPDAVHAETKALAKAAPALTENVVAARLYLEARGHDADDARRLAEYLHDKQAGGGIVERAKSFFGFGRGGAGGGEVRASGAATSTSEGGADSEQAADERAESRADADTTSSTEADMTDDELNEKLESLEQRLDDIDEKLSDAEQDAEEKDTNADAEGEGDGPSLEEKVDRLANATAQITEQVEQMADAQGVSQQADQGSGASEEKDVWSDDNSPFAAGGDA